MATHITNSTQLQAMKDAPTLDYILDNDIDLTGVPWVCIGNNAAPFTGTFDGQEFTISNLHSIAALASNYNSGLFGKVSGVAVIENVTIEDATIEASANGAVLCGYLLGGTIENCHVASSTISSFDSDSIYQIGGIVGLSSAATNSTLTTVTGCSVTNLTINDVDDFAGGICGFSQSYGNNRDYFENINFEDCTVTNVMIVPGNSGEGAEMGGVFGRFMGVCENCSATGAIIDAQDSCGGFAGELSAADVFDCSADVDVSIVEGTNSHYIGGFAGIMYNINLSKCFSLGNVTSVDGDYEDIGGFCGSISNSAGLIVKDCYSKNSMTLATVSGTMQRIGGFAGIMDSADLVLRNSYSDCAVSCSGASVTGLGGFAGYVDNDALTIQNSFSVGLLTATGTIGGFIGIMASTGANPTIDNCSWYTAIATNAIGNKNGSAVATLSGAGYGTDESDNTEFYNNTTHAVFAQ